jgi:hypothetical protein
MRFERSTPGMARDGLTFRRTPFETRKPEFGGGLGRRHG